MALDTAVGTHPQIDEFRVRRYGKQLEWWNWGQYSNPDADALIASIPAETDEAKLKETYTELVKYLPDRGAFLYPHVPSASLPHCERVGLDELPARWGWNHSARSAARPDRRLEHCRSL